MRASDHARPRRRRSRIRRIGLRGRPLGDLLERLASAEPGPAGGAAAALSGAAAAALLAMVCRISAGRAGEPPVQAVREVEEIRDELTALMDRDAAAVRRLLEAGRLPPDRRPAARRKALVEAVRAPVAVATAAARLVALGAVIAPAARKSTVADLGAALVLATTAVDAAVLITRANLATCDDAAFTRAMAAEADRLCAAAHARGPGVRPPACRSRRTTPAGPPRGAAT